MKQPNIAVIGSGAMGSGIAQVAAQHGHRVVLIDQRTEALEKSKQQLTAALNKLVEKGKLEARKADELLSLTSYSAQMTSAAGCGLVIEAVTEDLTLKKSLFAELETLVEGACILGTNTSSLSVTAIAAACQNPERVLGIHFFNPAPIMPLVEVVPALQTRSGLVDEMCALMKQWGKVPVVARDTPGFIVNRVARPFYGEALRICEEGIATPQEIDEAMRTAGGFRMGPFELMDLIGNDVNYAVTESVFRNTYYDARYRPSIIQLRMVEAGRLGRKTGSGYYSYGEGTVNARAMVPESKANAIVDRILAMLINEAYEAVHLGITTEEDVELAMTRGVNYPKGLLAWSRDVGLNKVVKQLDDLYHTYGDDRYRCSVRLRQKAKYANE